MTNWPIPLIHEKSGEDFNIVEKLLVGNDYLIVVCFCIRCDTHIEFRMSLSDLSDYASTQNKKLGFSVTAENNGMDN